MLCDIVTAQAAAPLTRAVISYPNANPRVAPLWIAQDLDFFSKYGIKGEVVFVPNNQSSWLPATNHR